jgi:uncharacterized protein involved in propanediol utilization
MRPLTGQIASPNGAPCRSGDRHAGKLSYRKGTARAPVHHGEIIQGAFRVDGRIRRGLVTIPCELYHSSAVFTPDTSRTVTVRPSWRSKALRVAQFAIREVEKIVGGRLGGRLEVLSDVPLCRGFGSSTSDVLASIWAVADAFDVRLPRETVAELAVMAETASDPLMFDESAVLFAHREGELIEDFGARLPPMLVLGFSRGNRVDTIAYKPARYSDRELDRFDELRVMTRWAVASQDAVMLGEVATASTWINQDRLPIPYLDSVCVAAREAGALGVHTAHSGSIGGLLFDQNDPELQHRIEIAQKLLGEVGYNDQWRFATGG